jgi:hypothetical protein
MRAEHHDTESSLAGFRIIAWLESVATELHARLLSRGRLSQEDGHTRLAIWSMGPSPTVTFFDYTRYRDELTELLEIYPSLRVDLRANQTFQKTSLHSTCLGSTIRRQRFELDCG